MEQGLGDSTKILNTNTLKDATDLAARLSTELKEQLNNTPARPLLPTGTSPSVDLSNYPPLPGPCMTGTFDNPVRSKGACPQLPPAPYLEKGVEPPIIGGSRKRSRRAENKKSSNSRNMARTRRSSRKSSRRSTRKNNVTMGGKRRRASTRRRRTSRK